MVDSFTASLEIGPLKSLAATAIDVCQTYDPSLPASHTEIKKVLKYRTKEFGFIWRSIASGYDECVETELKTAIWEQWTKEATTIPLFNITMYVACLI